MCTERLSLAALSSLGMMNPPSRPKAAGDSVAEETRVPIGSQGGEKGEAKTHAPHDVARSLLCGLRFLGSSLNDAFSEIHLEIDRVHVDAVIGAQTAEDLHKLNS